MRREYLRISFVFNIIFVNRRTFFDKYFAVSEYFCNFAAK